MLQANDVRFAYGSIRRRPVFDGLSWCVAPGVTTLLLGPNGAGKSTLLKLLAGQERTDSGSVTLNGIDERASLYARVGWMPQDIRAARGLSAREQVQYAAWVGGSARREAESLATEALQLVRLSDQAGVRSSALSGGQLRRLGLAQACVRGGDVLLLDEPTAGLDPAQTLNFRRVLKGLDYPGGVVISTHQVADLSGDFDRVAVLSKGGVIFDDVVEAFAEHGKSLGVTSGNLAETFSRMIRGEDA